MSRPIELARKALERLADPSGFVAVGPLDNGNPFHCELAARREFAERAPACKSSDELEALEAEVSDKWEHNCYNTILARASGSTDPVRVGMNGEQKIDGNGRL